MISLQNILMIKLNDYRINPELKSFSWLVTLKTTNSNKYL